MSAGIQVQTTGLPNLERMMRSWNVRGIRKSLKLIGALIEKQTRLRITKTKEGPDGKAWKKLDDAYARWKAKRSSGGILSFHDGLRDSIQWSVAGYDLEVGSNLKYAATHQHGRDAIEARPFLGVNDADGAEIEKLMSHYIDRTLKGRA